MKKIFILVALSFGLKTAYGQQRYITTLGNINGLNFNPAYAGINNSLDANLQMKQQWLSVPNAPKNANLQAHTRLAKIFGAGIQANYWTASLLSNVQFGLTGAVHLPLGTKFKLSSGLNLGFSQVSINAQNAIVYDNDVTLEQQNSGSVYGDLGFLLHSKRMQVGLSSPNVFSSRLGFNNLSYNTNRYMIAHAKYLFDINPKITLTPMFVYHAIPGVNGLVDGMIRVGLNNRFGVSAGYRSRSGLLASADIQLNENFKLAYAYDAGMSQLAGISKGSHEFLLGYSLAKKVKKAPYIQRYGEILVKDEKGTKLEDQAFEVVNKSTGVSQKLSSNSNGLVIFPIDTLSSYEIRSTSKDFDVANVAFQTPNKLNNNIQNEVSLIRKKAFITGRFVDDETGEPYTDVKITQTINGVEKVFYTNANGEFSIPVDENIKLNDSLGFNLKIEKDSVIEAQSFDVKNTLKGYGDVSLNSLMGGTGKEIKLSKFKVGGTINEVIDIKPIYFDFGSSEIRPDAAVELQKVVDVLKENPTMTIEVGAHSDCKGSAEGNLRLSEQRAQACVQFIQQQIDSAARVTGRGYGETVPLGTLPCEDKSVEEMAKDRRIEFKIVTL